MEAERRRFLLSMGALGILGTTPASLLAASVDTPPESLRDAFQARLGDWLYLYDSKAGTQGEVQLVNVADQGSSDSLEQFNLTLCSRADEAELPGGSYEISGELQALFIQHSHSSAGQNFYRAEFAVLR